MNFLFFVLDNLNSILFKLEIKSILIILNIFSKKNFIILKGSISLVYYKYINIIKEFNDINLIFYEIIKCMLYLILTYNNIISLYIMINIKFLFLSQVDK